MYDYFIVCKKLRIILERKQELITQKNYKLLIAHELKTRWRVNNNLVLPRYSKSKCQNSLIFRGIKLWNVTPNDIKQSTILA